MTVQLQHEDGENYRPNKVSVQVDNHTEDLKVDESGCVTVENQRHADELQETHGQFKVLEGGEEELPDHVLADKNVDEAKEYVNQVEDKERLKELRSKEDRKTAVQYIDDRIAEIEKEEEKIVDAEYEEVENKDETKKQDNGTGEEDGEEAEDE